MIQRLSVDARYITVGVGIAGFWIAGALLLWLRIWCATDLGRQLAAGYLLYLFFFPFVCFTALVFFDGMFQFPSGRRQFGLLLLAVLPLAVALLFPV